MSDGGVVLPIIGVVTALVGLVSFFVKWLIAQVTKADEHAAAREAACLERVASLEGRVQRLEADVTSERSAKHRAMSDSAAYLGTLRVVRHLHDTLDADAFTIALPRLLAAVPDRDRNDQPIHPREGMNL